jgi:hypothetical protein
MVDGWKPIPGSRIGAGVAQQGGGPSDGTSYRFAILSDCGAPQAAARKIEARCAPFRPGQCGQHSASIARPSCS